MSLFSFSKKNNEENSLVFNIGSGSVSGGIIKFTEKPGEDVVYYHKENIAFQQDVSVPKHIANMKSALANLASKIQAEGLKGNDGKTKKKIKLGRVFYFFSSPWGTSQTKTIRVSESKPFKVTESYLNHIIDEQEKKLQIDIAKSGKIIERKIVQIKINGYAVEHFINQSTTNLELSVFFTVVPNEVLEIVNEAISLTFNLKHVWCHSSALANFSLVRDMFHHISDYISIDISEEITEISIIRNNLISNMATIPLGRNSFIRELSKILNVGEEIADSQIKMHLAKNNDELANMKLAVEMDKAAKTWLTKITEVLDSFKEKIYVPESIFLISSVDLVPFLKDKLQKSDFKVLLVDNRKVHSFVSIDDIIFKLELMFLDNLYKI